MSDRGDDASVFFSYCCLVVSYRVCYYFSLFLGLLMFSHSYNIWITIVYRGDNSSSRRIIRRTVDASFQAAQLRPVHLLRVSLLRVLESNFPGDPL